MKYKIHLQLFATSSTKSGSTTATQTQGGSTSHEEGGGSSHTVSHSTTNSHTEGGSHSDTFGKTWASGKVEEQTQAQRDKYNTDYQEGNKVTDAYSRLQETLDKKPGFQSSYEDKLNSLYDAIMNRDPFSYNFNADPMYQMYKDQYVQQGKRAMQDTMGQAASLTGGYGSSYGQTAGQQTYQNYLQQLNDRIPEFRNMAYQQYQDEMNAELQKYNLTSDAYNREYGQYRDSMSDWQSDRAFNQGMYSDERNFDYNQFANERNYWNQEYWNERNAEQSTMSSTDERNWSDTNSVTDAESWTDYTNWADSVSTNWQNSLSNTSSWSNTVSDSGGGSKAGSSSVKAAAEAIYKQFQRDNTKTQTPPAQPTWQDSITQRVQQSLAQPGAIQTQGATDYLKQNGISTNNNNNSAYQTPSYNPMSVGQYNSQGMDISSAVNSLVTADTAVDRAIAVQGLRRQGYTDEQIRYIQELANGKLSW